MNIIKVFKPITPGTRHRVRINRNYKVPTTVTQSTNKALVNETIGKTERYLWNKRPEKSLLGGLCGNKAGRNNEGRITVYNRSGSRRLYRYIDFKRSNIQVGTIERFEYDPNRTAFIALVRSVDNVQATTNELSKVQANAQAKAQANSLSYVIATTATKVGDTIVSFNSDVEVIDQALANAQSHSEAHTVEAGQPLQNTIMHEFIPSNIVLTPGNAYCLKNIPVGKDVHSIAGKYVRAAGATAKLIKKTLNTAILRLPSSRLMEFPLDTIATLGIVSNIDHKNEVIGKAGTNRLRGRRPSVRGVAMNPVDHPHGGGGIARTSVTPWGKPTKGQPTRKKKRLLVKD